ncbi:MAG: 3-dehydroquinate synthase [Lachnospiraceae bacterium]|nr:3-dehydroquinate synthase [Lachnospiraceae bacterium]
MTLHMNLGENSYDIVIEPGALKRAGKYLQLDRRVLIVTDEGVPAEYAAALAAQCRKPLIVTVDQGEESKSIRVWEKLLRSMLEAGFLRTDAVAAVGGGVVGDLAGFTAACYMRGVDFYNIPTTVLSQVDSSIGGKTAVNFEGVKNIVGAFYQPKKVLVDTDLLSTLDRRQISNGLSEALKMAACFDEKLFSLFETEDPFEHIPEIVARSLEIKKAVVEQDEKEQGLRKALNFGHTIGHGIESVTGLLHGECVALGMLPMCSEEVRNRLVPVLSRLKLPLTTDADREKVLAALLHDKKAVDGGISCVLCGKAGSFEIRKLTAEELSERMKLL